MLSIQKKLIAYNFNKGVNNPQYIVIHDTGNVGKNANAQAHFNYFNGGNRGASAHYFVDDKNIMQFVEDKDASWHCGDGRGKFGISNRNSIGIEICINPESNYDVAVSNTIDLTIQLMKKHNISIDRVVTHNNASGKICPATMSKNNWAKWKEFKEAIKKKITSNTQNTTKPKGDESIVKFEHKWQEELLIESIETLTKQGLINNGTDWITKFKSGKLTVSELSLLSLAVSSRISENK